MFPAKLATGSKDNSCGVANPFVWLQRKSQLVESGDGEDEESPPLPIGQIEVVLGIWRDIFWKLGINRNFSEVCKGTVKISTGTGAAEGSAVGLGC